jgi:hypothetical protein
VEVLEGIVQGIVSWDSFRGLSIASAKNRLCTSSRFACIPVGITASHGIKGKLLCVFVGNLVHIVSGAD